MIRRTLALSLVAVLALVAPAGAEESTVGVGTAQNTLDLADVTISGLPVAGLNLGGLTSYASTIPDATLNALGGGEPFALSSVRLPVGGEVGARSDRNTSRPGQTVNLGVGTLTVGDLLATVDNVEARSVVNALTGSVDAGLAGLGVSATGVNSVVSATDAAAVNGAILQDLSLDLTDILPLEILQQLPLDVLIGLLDELGIDLNLPATLSRTLRDVRLLVDQLEAIDTVHDIVDSAQSELEKAGARLDEAVDDVSDLTAEVTTLVPLVSTACEIQLPDNLDALTTVVDDLLGVGGGLIGTVGGGSGGLGSIVDEVDGIISGGGSGGGSIVDEVVGKLPKVGLFSTSAADHNPCHTLQTTVDQLLSAEDTVKVLNKLIDRVQTTLDEAVELVDGLLDELLVLIESLDLANLPGLLQGLVDGLAGTELLGLERLAVGVTSFADANGSSASTLCDLRGLHVLGQPLADSCDTLEGALADVTGIVSGLLDELPIVGTVSGAAVNLPEIVSASAPTPSSSGDNERDGDFFVSSATVDGLRLNVASLQLGQVTDALLGDLLAQVDGLVDELSGMTGIDVDLSAVEAAVGQVLALVDGLPTGDLLAGVTTPGLGLAALDLGTQSQFSAAGSGLTPIGTPGTPGYVPPTGQTPGPATPSGDLPTTGGGVAAALALLLTGAGAMWWLRRRPAV